LNNQLPAVGDLTQTWAKSPIWLHPSSSSSLGGLLVLTPFQVLELVSAFRLGSYPGSCIGNQRLPSLCSRSRPSSRCQQSNSEDSCRHCAWVYMFAPWTRISVRAVAGSRSSRVSYRIVYSWLTDKYWRLTRRDASQTRRRSAPLLVTATDHDLPDTEEKDHSRPDPFCDFQRYCNSQVGGRGRRFSLRRRVGMLMTLPRYDSIQAAFRVSGDAVSDSDSDDQASKYKPSSSEPAGFLFGLSWRLNKY